MVDVFAKINDRKDPVEKDIATQWGIDLDPRSGMEFYWRGESVTISRLAKTRLRLNIGVGDPTSKSFKHRHQPMLLTLSVTPSHQVKNITVI